MISLVQTHNATDTRWLSLKQASALLGVNANSLRAWADQGAVRSFRTPGGHRRFAEADLLTFTANARRGSRPDILDKAVARIRRKIPVSPIAHEPWVDLLVPEERGELRGLGRRLVELAVDYLATPKSHGTLNVEARNIGERYGRMLGSHGLAFSQMLEAFLFFRNQVEEHVPSQAGSASTTTPHRALSAFLDQVLLGAVRGYEGQAAQLPPVEK